ncbi:MAG TPA: hypothetical protein VHS35_08760, partial [Pseudonocardia sp.]|nr:hypothetical protein [Pseudonocardia sp.]
LGLREVDDAHPHLVAVDDLVQVLADLDVRDDVELLALADVVDREEAALVDGVQQLDVGVPCRST